MSNFSIPDSAVLTLGLLDCSSTGYHRFRQRSRRPIGLPSLEHACSLQPRYDLSLHVLLQTQARYAQTLRGSADLACHTDTSVQPAQSYTVLSVHAA